MATEASAKVIDGKSVAKDIQGEITAEISRMKNEIGVVPGLAVILVGALYLREDNPHGSAGGLYKPHGVQNFPIVGLVDGNFRNLEEIGMGYSLEVHFTNLKHSSRQTKM